MAESLYRNKTSLEAIFRILDKDNSGQISLEEFSDACHLLHKHLPEYATEEELLDMCKMMDINKDGLVDLNEFLETFRLCDQARRGSVFARPSVSLDQASAHESKAAPINPVVEGKAIKGVNFTTSEIGATSGGYIDEKEDSDDEESENDDDEEVVIGQVKDGVSK